MSQKHQELRQEYDVARNALHVASDALEAAAEGNDATALEQADAKFKRAKSTADEASDRLELFERTQEARSLAFPDGTFSGEGQPRSRVRVNSEPLTYERGNGQSFFRDQLNLRLGDRDAFERLGRHRQEMQVEMRDGTYALSSTDGAGGDFVPPLYLAEDYASIPHSSRPFTSVLNRRPLPPQTDTLNIPRVTTGAAVAGQADNEKVESQDPVTDTISVPVRTIAGQVDVSRQSLERSIPGLDEVIFADLYGCWCDLFEQQVINGSGTGTAMKGVLQISGIESVTYTDASPTVPELYPKLAQGIAVINTARRKAPDVILMHPRRWAWILAERDTSNRPLVVPASGMNPVGEMVPQTAEGFVGSLLGLPVVASSQVPTTLGSGTNEDRIVIGRREELLVWDQQPTTKVFEDVGSGSLTVRLQMYSYGAFCAGRYPAGICVISGTGLSSPTFG